MYNVSVNVSVTMSLSVSKHSLKFPWFRADTLQVGRGQPGTGRSAG